MFHVSFIRLLFQHENCYGELFILALRQYGILCLGLYRLLDPSEMDVRHRKRYVITHPPFHFSLISSDKVGKGGSNKTGVGGGVK